MGQQVTVNELLGLTPLIDPKRINAALIVDGANFFMPPDGPTSGFARNELLHRGIVNPKGLQSFQITQEGVSFLFTSEAILQYDQVARRVFPRLTFPPTTELWPWTFAVVGGDLYFTRKGSGLIRYATATAKWEVLSGPAIPINIVALCASGGRLCLLARGIFAWSAIDNGTDFVASTITGAGAQSLSLVNAAGADQALMCLPYEFGVLSYTTEGIMRSELIETGINPFRHRAISNEHVPINPYCVISLQQDQQVLLTRSGFYTTTGLKPEPWQPVWSEFLHLTVLPPLDLRIPGLIRLDTNFDRSWFFVSITDGVDIGVYNRTYMLYLPTDKWGSFDRIHAGFIDIGPLP